MSDHGELTVSVRDARGKGAARTLRRQGLIPGVLYGQGKDNLSLSLDPLALRKAADPERSWNTFFRLTVKQDGKPDVVEAAVLVDVQTDAVRDDILHVDFMRVDPQKEVLRKVPLHIRGRAAGVFKGGRLKTFRRWLRVAAKPADIPTEVVVDVTPVEAGESLRMKDVTLESGRIMENPEHRVLTVEIPKAKREEEEEEKPAAAAAAPGAAEAGKAPEAKKD